MQPPKRFLSGSPSYAIIIAPITPLPHLQGSSECNPCPRVPSSLVLLTHLAPLFLPLRSHFWPSLVILFLTGLTGPCSSFSLPLPYALCSCSTICLLTPLLPTLGSWNHLIQVGPSLWQATVSPVLQNPLSHSLAVSSVGHRHLPDTFCAPLDCQLQDGAGPWFFLSFTVPSVPVMKLLD